MGNNLCPPPKEIPPQKSLKEITKEFMRTINRLRREFQREINQLEQNNKKIQRDIEDMAKRKEQRSTMRIIAQNILKNNQYITKYKRLDAQLSDVSFQLQSAVTTETMVKVMQGMGGVMKQANSSLNVQNIQQAMENFNMQMEKQNMMQEQIEEVLQNDEDEINDEDVNKIVIQAEQKAAESGGGGGGQKQIQQQPQQQNQDINQLEDRLNNLK